MGVKPGYKQTEVGVIPDDWDVKTLGDLKPFVTSGSRGWASYYSERGDLFVRITNLSRGSIYLDLTDSRFVKLPPEAREGIRTQLNEHDILISITADIGIVGYVDASAPSPAYINQHIALVRLDPSKTSGRFVSYFLSSEKPQRLFRAATDTGAKAGMSLLTVQKIQTVLPPLPEQHAIARALSDVDGLLSGLDRLIAKKHDLKQAAMQQLLTGQTRLPGFSEKWEVVSLNEITQKRAGFWGVESRDAGHQKYVQVIRAGDIAPNGELTVTAPRYFSDSEFAKAQCKLGEVVMTCSGSVGKVWLCDGRRDVAVSNFVRVLRPNSQRLHGRFLSELLRSAATQGLMVEHIAKGVLANLSASFFSKRWLNLPPVLEQTAIAEVLAEMDAELAALEQRREKTRDLKQAMMQELLTGRTRLL